MTDSVFSTYTASTTAQFVVPYFYGFYPNLPTDFGVTPNGTLAALYAGGGYSASSIGSKTISLNGSGYIYFCYDANYGPLSSTLDNNGFSLVYSTNVYSVDSPNGLWTSKNYRFYWFATPTTLTGEYYQFIF